MDTYSASPYPLLDGNNGADTPGAYFFRRKNKKTSPSTNQASPSASSSTYEPSIAQSDATTLVPDDKNNNTRDADLVRPVTPTQCSRSSTWSSYRNLPSEHPVFAYSDEARAELYERGIDPIVQAEVEAAERRLKRSSADGQAKGFWKQSASRLKTFAAC